MITLRTIDAHVAGQALRLVIDGFPAPRGKRMLDKAAWAGRHADHLRRMLLFEPRGHRDLCGALLTEPVLPGSDAGLLFMDNAGFSAMSSHGVIATTAIAMERGLLTARDQTTIVYDTPAGTIRARQTPASIDAAALVRFTNAPSFVLSAGAAVRLAGRTIRADVAFGGAFYGIVDGESAGLPLDVAHVPELRRLGMDIQRELDAHGVEHPLESDLRGIDGIVFTGPANDSRADLRCVTVFADGAVDRSPGGTALCAVMAVLSAMNLLEIGQIFIGESLIGTTLAGRIEQRTTIGDRDAIAPEITGTAWLTGEHSFFVDDDDPLREGVKV